MGDERRQGRERCEGGQLFRWRHTGDRDRLALVLDRSIEYGIYALALFPLGIGEAFRSIGVSVPLAAWLIKLCVIQRSRPKLSLRAVGFLLFTGSLLLSALLSIDPPVALWGFRKYFLKSAIVFLVISQNFTTQQKRARLGRVLACSGCVLVLAGFFDFFRGSTEGGGMRAFNVSRNVFAAVMGSLIPFIVACALTARFQVERLLFSLFFFLGLAAVVLTLSRGGWLNLLTSLCIWGIFLFKSRRALVLRTAAAIAGLGLMVFLASPQGIVARLPVLPEHRESLRIRVSEIWYPSLEAIRERPVFGWGPSEAIVARVYPTYFERSFGKQSPGTYPGTHSLYISILFFGGWTAFTAYLIFVSAFLMALLKRLKETGIWGERALMIAVLSSFVAVFLAHGFLEGSYLFVTFGLIAGFGEAFHTGQSAESQRVSVDG